MGIINFQFKRSGIDGLIEIVPFNADDIRGCFTKDYSKELFEANGIHHDIAETFYSTSHKGVLRGLHIQRVKQQSKLVRCVCGHVYDVVVDLRPKSSTYKQYCVFDLCEEKHNEILVPPYCAHGFLALEENSIVSYKCAEKFYSEYDDGIRWDDPDLSVHWPLERIGGAQNLILSEKDKNLRSFKEYIQLPESDR